MQQCIFENLLLITVFFFFPNLLIVLINFLEHDLFLYIRKRNTSKYFRIMDVHVLLYITEPKLFLSYFLCSQGFQLQTSLMEIIGKFILIGKRDFVANEQKFDQTFINNYFLKCLWPTQLAHMADIPMHGICT